MRPRSISLLHPFSAKAIGLDEHDLYESHSKPHELALLGLQKNGYSVTIEYFTGRWIPYKKTINDIIKRFWPVTSPWFKKRHSWRKQKSFVHQKLSLINPPDLTIINMSGHGSSYVFNYVNLLVKMQKPYITMIGGIHMTMTGKALNYYQNAAQLIVHTNAQKKELQKNRDFKKLDIRVLPLGIDVKKFKPLNVTDKESFSLLFVGRISRLKQIELAINAVAYLVDEKMTKSRLVIIGPVSDEPYFKELQLLISKFKIEKHVFFKGIVAQDSLIHYYQNADILLMPSAHESFGMVIVEAMACGTPVIALKGSGGPNEIIEDGVNGIVTTQENYNNAILNYFKNKKLQQEMSKQARLKVINNYSIQTTTNVLRISIEDALNYYNA